MTSAVMKGAISSSLEALPASNFKSKVNAPKNPKLIRQQKRVAKLTPSQFMREMSMDTKQKLATTNEMYLPQIIELLDMGETSLQKNTSLSVDEPMFQPFPSEIFYQKYEKFKTYEVPLLLRNNDKVPRLIKVTQVDTPYFRVLSPPDSHHKVGPGLSITFTIQFTPEDSKDYQHELIVTTEREKFLVPIVCIGSRAILDFPDEVNFPVTPVKYLQSKTLLIRNIGDKDAKFAIKSKEPFKVTPDHGILPLGESTQIAINFQPMQTGNHEGELIVCYETGENIYVRLHGVSQDINVRLDKNTVHIEDTYITMTNQRTIQIHNRSDVIVHYEWKKYATVLEEEQQKLKAIVSLNREEENSKTKIIDQSPDYMALLSRNFQYRAKNAKCESYLFDDEVFFIEPLQGDIWPNQSIDVSIAFKPDVAQTYSKYAFCEIVGRESRLPLKLFGVGSGPKVRFSIENLDVGNIFVGSTHVYEVVMENKSFIDAIYSINAPNSTFGKCFQFEPNESLISPDGYQAIRVTFRSGTLGSFKEIFEFTIDGKPERVPLTISGKVIAPTFDFDTPKLKFGTISYGFKYAQSCCLTNTSLVPMTFNLRVVSDTDLTSQHSNSSQSDAANFKEFSIQPSTGTIPPQSDTKVLVEFIPHFIKKYETSLAVDVENVGQELFLLPISARATVPNVTLLTSTIDMGRCFINHIYTKIIKLSNENSLPARYFILQRGNQEIFKFKSAQPEGIIEANSIKELQIDVEALQLGYISSPLLIKINGSQEEPLQCTFECLSQGPVIQMDQKEIDWGSTQLLQDVTKEIMITNESLIVAKYSANMLDKNSAWKIEPSEGSIRPGAEVALKATCHLFDKRKYNDIILIDIENSHQKEIKVRAQGVGTSIVSEPQIGTLIDFGIHFYGGDVRRTFKLCNKSSRTHSLSFQPDGRSLTSINKKEMAKEKELPKLIFKISPHRLDLYPEETKEITVEGFSDKPQLIEELYSCQAIIGKASGKDRIMRFKVRCEFIEPLVSFSSNQIYFRLERAHNELLQMQTKTLTLSNISVLPLTAQIVTQAPFSIKCESIDGAVSSLETSIKSGDYRRLEINFDPSFKKDLYNQTVNEFMHITYKEHQHMDTIELRGDLFFPNIQLESKIVDFGCVLNNTEHTQYLNMTNIGPIPVIFRWNFVLDDKTLIERLSYPKDKSFIEHTETQATNNEPNIIIEQIYDTNDDTNMAQAGALKSSHSNYKVTSDYDNSQFDLSATSPLPNYEEIFDISPIYGKLNPGETQKVLLTFFAHHELKAIVNAVCQVENGPMFDLTLRGQASVLNYEISRKDINMSHVPYDSISEQTIVVKNKGQVILEFNVLKQDGQSIEAEKPFVQPAHGFIEPEKDIELVIKYLPGIPSKFNKKVLLQISHFSPDEISVYGEASFSNIILDLPRVNNENFRSLVDEAKQNEDALKRKFDYDLHIDDIALQVEVDRLAMEKYIKERKLFSRDSLKQVKSFEGSVLSADGAQQLLASPNSQAKSSSKRNKPLLPDYLLDFGHVILGTVRTKTIKIVNVGEILASFDIERQNFSRTGFTIDLEKVSNLPNTKESLEFMVTFDPRGANLGLGQVEHLISINVMNGPLIRIRALANVTMPDLQISNDVVDFKEVKCGECKIVTVQINNHKEVRCDWAASYLPNKDDKFTPLHLKRKKQQAELTKPRFFEIMPPSGTLLPGQKLNIQLKFMPTEEKYYEERVTIRMAQSSQRLMVLCKGKGLEPQIIFEKNLLEFEPILPHNAGDEQEVRVRNPCSFPIEIYNLEFDKTYLVEEKILRTIRGYDEFNTILLPPRNVKLDVMQPTSLPERLQKYYDEQVKKFDEEEKKMSNEEQMLVDPSTPQNQQLQDSPIISARQTQLPQQSPLGDAKEQHKVSSPHSPVGDLEKNPVYEAIADYLGIDLSDEGRAARNRRGIAIMVHGAPLTGKTTAARALAKHYNCALLNIDNILSDAIAKGTSPAALKARQLCADQATQQAIAQRALEGHDNPPGINIGAGPLSEKLLELHTNQQPTVPASKKTSEAGASHTKGNKKKPVTENTDNDEKSLSPEPLLQPLARKLSVTLAEYEDGFVSVILPEDIFVDILNERFLAIDCQQGIIIDGLDTVFCQTSLHAASGVLKAFNNRRFIYCITLKSDFNKYKDQLNKLNEEKIRLAKEREELERLAIEEMDEESYDNLPDEKKQEIDMKLLEAKKLRLKKEKEEKERLERIEREKQEQLAKDKEEKEGKNKRGKKMTSVAPAIGVNTTAQSTDTSKKTLVPPGGSSSKSQSISLKTDKQNSLLQNPTTQNETRPHTRSDNQDDSDKKNRKRLDSSSKILTEEDTLQQQQHQQSKEKIVDPEEEKKKQAELILQQKFKTFDVLFKDICTLLDSWDRSQGTVNRPTSPSDRSEHDDANALKGKKLTNKTKSKEKSISEKQMQQQQQQQQAQQEAAERAAKENNKDSNNIDFSAQDDQNENQLEDEKKPEALNIPHIVIDNVNSYKLDEIHTHSRLPLISEVLDGMGMGPKGPPIPPEATFAVIPYPIQRQAPASAEFGHYSFVTNQENDPNVVAEKSKEIPLVSESQQDDKDERQSDTKEALKSKTGSKEKRGASRSESKQEQVGEKRKPSGDRKKDLRSRRESGQSPISDGIKHPHSALQNDADGGTSVYSEAIDKPSVKINRFRWIIAPQSEIIMRLRFTSDTVGQFDQTLNFEIVGTRRRYQLFCRGVCTFPTISREPRIVFPGRKKNRAEAEIIHKKYILSDEVFEFGPLLIGSSKERIKEGKFIDYLETFTIQNASSMEAEVSFCFLDENSSTDKQDPCFYTETNELILKPNESKALKIYAVPKENRHYEDSLICCIKENPEPVIFKVSCYGQKPELVLDKKEFAFKQVLLHRKDTRDIKMSNPTMIPVQWRLEGVDLLGDEFVCNQTSGIIEPNANFNLVLHFRALKPLIIASKDRKALKLIVSDVGGIIGPIENHIIFVTAEAYDVALEINLPKGNDGGLDFGTIRVNTENKQICTLKNKGKYPIKYNFLIEATGKQLEEIQNYLSVIPASGELLSVHDRNSQNQQIQVIINTKKEIQVKDESILKCQITEPTVNEGTIIANIPIKISCKAVFSKFNIIPHAEINFGVTQVNGKRTEKLIIENKGDFDFKFTIAKANKDHAKTAKLHNARDGDKPRGRDGSSVITAKGKRESVSNITAAPTGRFQIGAFTITPAVGLILQGGFQPITIDFSPELANSFDEEILIDITDRDTYQYPNGIFYKLFGEAVAPTLSLTPDVFEEHTIIPNMSVFDSKSMGLGVYCEEENKFIFNNVIVSRTAKARYKIFNSNKIPIDLLFQVRANTGRTTRQTQESAFEIEPQRAQVPSYGCAFVTVSFTPLAMTSYTSTFEAQLENGLPINKNKPISFEIVGDGNLPRFTVVKPSVRNSHGQHLMLFKRTIVGFSDSQSLTLTNEGTLPTKINFKFKDPDDSFKILCPFDNSAVTKLANETVTAVVIQPNQEVSFNIVCTPKKAQKYAATLELIVTDNQFEDTIVQMIGEGYAEDITFDNLHSVGELKDDEVIVDDDVSALKCNLINFGDVYVNDKKSLIVSMTNRNKTNCYRFEWPENAFVSFSPRVGHLHAECVKDILVTFKASEAKTLKKELFNCQVVKVAFDVPINEIKDWDDRKTIVKWINETIQVVNPVVNEARPSSPAVASSAVTSTNTLGQMVNQPNKFTTQTIRKKVTDMEPEPKYTRVDETQRNLDLFLSANCDYCKVKCSCYAVRFKDTFMFQTRVYEITLSNRGRVELDYNWKVQMEDSRRPFTPFIESDTPSPELSSSPRRRGSKGPKDSSLSPQRKLIGGGGKESQASSNVVKKDSKEGGKAALTAKKSSSDEQKSQTKPSVTKKKSSTKSEAKDSRDTDGASSKDQANEQDGNDSYNQQRPESQAHMRAESALSIQTPSIMAEEGYVPFSMEPSFGRIEPGKSQTFKLKFSPLDINDYQAKLTCTIPNLEEGKMGVTVSVKGRGLLPYCHFDLDESDYITAGRRDPELQGVNGAAPGLGLDRMTKVIEFKSIGITKRIFKKFNIINPTSQDYSFEWIEEGKNDVSRRDPFECKTRYGLLKSGLRHEVAFECNPYDVGLFESFWTFSIPKLNLTIPFLLVGDISEPRIVFDRSFILFEALLIGMTGTQTILLINQESQPFEFNFDQNSCYTEGRSSVLLVEPMNGIIAANARFPVQLTLKPREQTQLTFNLKCNIVNATKPLQLNIKAEAHSILTNVFYEDTFGAKIEFSGDRINEIRLGEIEKNEITFRNVYVLNSGKHTLDCEWFLTTEHEECFSIEPKLAHVEPGEKQLCVLRYHAKREKLTSANLVLKVEHGSVYHVYVEGIAVKPDVQFSFQNYNFGACFVYKAGMPIKCTNLSIRNAGTRETSIDCLFNSPKSCFSIDFKQSILNPGESIQVPITFIPRENTEYQEKLIFELNGLTKREIVLMGSGSEMKIELVDSRQKQVDLGTLQIGKTSKKVVKIMNRSQAQVEFSLILESKNELINTDHSILQINPCTNIKLKPNQIFEFQITFSPKRRMPKFYEEIKLEYNGVCMPICGVTGTCHGYNIWMEMNTIAFGAVVQKCSTMRRLVMHNDGDIGASFKWDVERLKPEFSIQPTHGYISPGMEIFFELVFNPQDLSQDIRKESVACTLEGCRPLQLTVTGSCVQVTPQKELYNFDTFVRQKDIKQISIQNKTNATWELKPLIEGEYFSGIEVFTVEAQTTKLYEVTYLPLMMTQDGKKHMGSIFFPLPDGTGLLYSLNGVSGPPKPSGKIQRDVPCKTNFTELIIIENWLKKPQRFKVNFEIVKPEKPDLSTTLKGHDYVDVPADSRKEYKVNYYSHKEGVTQAKVNFKNEKTGEYVFYELTFKAIKSGSIGSIDLITQVRVPMRYSLTLENPLPNPVTFTPTCNNQNEILLPPSLQITAKGHGEFSFEYLPLKTGESVAKLELNSNDLGLCVYDLNLKALAPQHERPIHFKTYLGSSQSVQAKFQNLCKQKTDYFFKCDNTDFKTADKSLTTAPSQTPIGSEVSFDIIYEPSNLGEFKTLLAVTSPHGGDYIFPLHGTCLLPKPQGPYVIKNNANISIQFKNIFSTNLNFSFAIDNPHFMLAKPSDTIKAHQTYKIVVGYVNNENKNDHMAKLVVTPPKQAGVSSSVQWIYYLKGVSS